MHLWLVTLAISLVFLNGFFVAAEFSIVRLRETQIDGLTENEAFRGKLLKFIHRNLDNYLSACQLGITLASIGLGWVGEPVMAELLKPIFQWLSVFSKTTITIISFGTAYFIISFLHIVLGELVPKSMAIRNAKEIALWTAIPLHFFYIVFRPLINLLNFCSNQILNIFKINVDETVDPNYSVEELKTILKAGHLEHEIDKQEIDILMQVLEFTELLASDLMRPADEMITLSLENSMKENLEIIKEHRFSRYPLYSEDPNNIIGILHIKDLLISMEEFGADKEKIRIDKLIRTTIEISEDTEAIEIFNQFKKGRVHFAIVKNKHSLVIGFITLDNVLIGLLGNIRDEFSKIKPDWLVTERGNLLMKGSTPVYILEKALNIDISTEANTLNGLIMNKLERLPNPNELIQFPGFELLVYKMKGPKVTLVKVTKSA